MRAIILSAFCVVSLVASHVTATAEDTVKCESGGSQEALVKCLNINIEILNAKLAKKLDSAGPFLIRNKNEGECLVVVSHVLKLNKDCQKQDVQYQFDLQ